MSAPTELVIVGGGLAAAGLVASLRTRGYGGEITVVSGESLMPYDRPPLSKELYTRDQPTFLAEQLGMDPDSAEWVLGAQATSLTPLPGGGGHVTYTRGGQVTVAAPTLVIATGAAPVVPPMLAGALTLSTFADAQHLRAQLAAASDPTLTIIGAGWIGMELASSATAAGVHVTVLEAAGRPLAVLPEPLGRRIGAWLEVAGVDFRPGTSITHIDGTTVHTAAGPISASAVVAATGAQPRTAWLPAPLRSARGHVPTDAFGRTEFPGIWGIGDAAAPNQRADQHWNSALHAAERCAAAILGEEPTPPQAPHVFSHMFGHEIDLIGRPAPGLDVAWREHGTGWTGLIHGRGMLYAGLAVDSPRDAAELKRVLRGGAIPFKPADADIPRLRDLSTPRR